MQCCALRRSHHGPLSEGAVKIFDFDWGSVLLGIGHSLRLRLCGATSLREGGKWCAKQTDKLEGTSKNSPFAIWAHLSPQLFAAKSPQYTKYSKLSAA